MGMGGRQKRDNRSLDTQQSEWRAHEELFADVWKTLETPVQVG